VFRETKVFSSLAVPDMQAAKQFYGGTLELDVEEIPEGLAIHLGVGSGDLFLYPSETFAPSKHTVLNFVVDDVEAAVEELARRGVNVERYDLPDIKTDAKGIARGGGSGPSAIAWFKDPAGHILSVLQE
jgi:predicted enzyme related to lactoylglutathione lyase